MSCYWLKRLLSGKIHAVLQFVDALRMETVCLDLWRIGHRQDYAHQRAAADIRSCVFVTPAHTKIVVFLIIVGPLALSHLFISQQG